MYLIYFFITQIVGFQYLEFQGVYRNNCSYTNFNLELDYDKLNNIVNITYSQNITYCDSPLFNYETRLVGKCRNGYEVFNNSYISCSSTYWAPANPQQIYLVCNKNNKIWTCKIKFYNGSIMDVGPMYLQTDLNQSSGYIIKPFIYAFIILLFMFIY